MSELESAAREVYKYAKIAVNQIICMGGDESCQPCENREQLAVALDELERVLSGLTPAPADDATTEPYFDPSLPKGGFLSVLRCLLSVILFSCSDTLVPMPNGYKLLCSPDGKYTVWLPNEQRISVNVFNTKQKASEYANYWEKRRISESQKYQWNECR